MHAALRKFALAAAMIAAPAGMARTPAHDAPSPSAPGAVMVYIGTQGEALLSSRMDLATGKLETPATAARLVRPTWLTISGDRLFSVSEKGNYDEQKGDVVSFAVNPSTGGLTALSSASSGGGGPTFLSYSPAARTIFVSNFGSGDVAALPVDAAGRVKEPASIVKDVGSGPTPKQKSAHAHAALLAPGGRHVLVPDMGADKIFIYSFNPATRRLAPATTPFLFTGPGTGPRHATFSADGRFFYVLTEHASDIRVLRWLPRAGQIAPVQTVPMDPPGFSGHSSAEIGLSPNGRTLYVSNRARNLIQVYAIAPAAGTLTHVQDLGEGIQRPRSFGITPDGRWMLVGNQDAQTITVLSVDPASGKLTATGQTVSVPTEKPVAFAFYPLRSAPKPRARN